MMGRLKSDQGQLFYEFRLGDAVPEDHMVRKIDTALDLSWLRSDSERPRRSHHGCRNTRSAKMSQRNLNIQPSRQSSGGLDSAFIWAGSNNVQ
jgi:hypothetical protein